jgi:hypothetical protein
MRRSPRIAEDLQVRNNLSTSQHLQACLGDKPGVNRQTHAGTVSRQIPPLCGARSAHHSLGAVTVTPCDMSALTQGVEPLSIGANKSRP